MDKEPPNCKAYRGWDKAASEPSEANRYPDYTASIKILKDSEGRFYIRGDFSENQRDDKSTVYGIFRKRPGERDARIMEQAMWDGDDCTIVLAKDPGAAGEVEYMESARKLMEAGFHVMKDPAPGNSNKVSRFSPFSSAAESGLVSIVESSFPNKETLEAFYKALESFTGEKSTRSKKDDWPDATATAFNAASRGKVLPKFSLPSNTSTTLKSRVMGSAVPVFGN